MLNGLRQSAVVKPGGLIEIKSADLPVGSTVEVIVLVDPAVKELPPAHPLNGLSYEERIAKIREALGGWKDDSEIAKIFVEIDRDRLHSRAHREISIV